MISGIKDFIKKKHLSIRMFVVSIIKTRRNKQQIDENKEDNDFFNILLSTPYKIMNLYAKCKCVWLSVVEKAINKDGKLGKKRLFYVLLIGLCNGIATTPFCLIIVLPLTFGTLFYILDKQKKKFITSLATLFVFLFGYFISIFWWFFVPLTTDFLHLFWITPFAIFGLPFIMALIFICVFFFGFLLYYQVFIKRKTGMKWAIKIISIIKKEDMKIVKFKDDDLEQVGDIAFFFIFLICWYIGDYIRGHIVFGGFPWMMFGHFVPFSFAFQSVKLLGIDLYSIFFLALVFVPYNLICKKQNLMMKGLSICIIVAWIVNCFSGFIVLSSAKKDLPRVNIIGSQINHPASLNISRDAIDIANQNLYNLSWAAYSSKDAVMLMPESSLNFPIYSGSKHSALLGRILPTDGSLLLAGGIKWQGTKVYNVIYGITKSGYIIATYKKQKLVPFGEYLPMRSLLEKFMKPITEEFGDFYTDGEKDNYIFYRDLPFMYPIICYESIFPSNVKKQIEESRKQLSKLDKKYMEEAKLLDVEKRGEIIVNLTNDAWMKWSVAPYQYFLMTRFLAVSVGLPVVRVSNNGISAYIDRYGRVAMRTKLNKKDILFVKGKYSE